MSLSRSLNPGALVLLVAALSGFAIALYAYLVPLTGVNGTLGAALVIITCLALAAAGAGLMALKGGALHNLLRAAILALLAGTAFAALLLHLWWLAIVMVFGLAGLVFEIARPTHRTRTQGVKR